MHYTIRKKHSNGRTIMMGIIGVLQIALMISVANADDWLFESSFAMREYAARRYSIQTAKSTNMISDTKRTEKSCQVFATL